MGSPEGVGDRDVGDRQEGDQQTLPRAFALIAEIASIPEDVSFEQFEGALVRAAVAAGYESAGFVTVTGDVNAWMGQGSDGVDVQSFDHPRSVTTISCEGRTFVAIPIVGNDEGYGTLLLEVEEDRLSRPERAQFERIRAILADRLARRDRRRRRDDELAAARRTFRKIHSVAIQMVGIDYEMGVYQLAIDAAENVLSFDDCSIVEVEDGRFTPALPTAQIFETDADEMAAHTGLAGEAFQEKRTIVVDDVRDAGAEITGTDESYRSLLFVPIEGVGIFQAAATDVGAFDDRDVDLAELLMSYVSQSVTRIHHEEELERQNERLEAFASVVSHDLRSPLTVASGRLELARETGDTSHLERAAEALDRMDSLIENVLTLAREGRTVGSLSRVDVASIAEDAWESVATKSAVLRVTDSEIVVNADSDRLRQMLENLFRNAIEHGGDDVTVTVGSLDDGFYVADDGKGIAEDGLNQLFERGYTTEESGTGFGLAIVSDIVEAHEWTIEAVPVETGARFEITDVDSP